KMDIFRLQRVIVGDPVLRDDIERGGVRGVLQMRRATPAPPEQGWGAVPPGSPELKESMFRRMHWGDEVPTGARAQQSAWYSWQTNVAWAEAWNAHTPQWIRPL